MAAFDRCVDTTSREGQLLKNNRFYELWLPLWLLSVAEDNTKIESFAQIAKDNWHYMPSVRTKCTQFNKFWLVWKACTLQYVNFYFNWQNHKSTFGRYSIDQAWGTCCLMLLVEAVNLLPIFLLVVEGENVPGNLTSYNMIELRE